MSDGPETIHTITMSFDQPVYDEIAQFGEAVFGRMAREELTLAAHCYLVGAREVQVSIGPATPEGVVTVHAKATCSDPHCVAQDGANSQPREGS